MTLHPFPRRGSSASEWRERIRGHHGACVSDGWVRVHRFSRGGALAGPRSRGHGSWTTSAAVQRQSGRRPSVREGKHHRPSARRQTFAQGRFDTALSSGGLCGQGLSPFIKRFNYNNNLIGSVTLINAAINHGVKCFVFTSSIAVDQTSPDLPLMEGSPTRPEDSYGSRSSPSNLSCRPASGCSISTTSYRPHNVYGERQNIGDKYRTLSAFS